MKVYMGKYPSWFGPYQLADLTQKLGVSEGRAFQLGGWLSNTWVSTFLSWVHTFKKQKVKVTIHKYDTWSMDHTLAHVIHPMLIQLKESKHGAPNVDDEDVPEELRKAGAPPLEEYYDVDANHFKRWEWVLDEMIWVFGELIDNNSTDKFYDHSAVDNKADLNVQVGQIKIDFEGLEAHEERMKNALRLFGKYFRALWD